MTWSSRRAYEYRCGFQEHSASGQKDVGKPETTWTPVNPDASQGSFRGRRPFVLPNLHLRLIPPGDRKSQKLNYDHQRTSISAGMAQHCMTGRSYQFPLPGGAVPSGDALCGGSTSAQPDPPVSVLSMGPCDKRYRSRSTRVSPARPAGIPPPDALSRATAASPN
jgi:hypothetical protein